MTQAHSATAPAFRYVLLGASNLTMACPLLLENLLRATNQPVDVYAALGHGRSFLGGSSILWRELPGIADCGLWENMLTASGTKTRALITDVGNDLLYGYPVAEIVAAVETCLLRLQQSRADIILTLPPWAAVQHLSRWRFAIFRRVLFPACRLSFRAVLASAHRLVDALSQLGRNCGVSVVTPPAEWYGWDPIHIRRSGRISAWQAVCRHWHDFPGDDWMKSSRQCRRLFRGTRPAHYRWRSRDIREPQPTLRSHAGTLSLY